MKARGSAIIVRSHCHAAPKARICDSEIPYGMSGAESCSESGAGDACVAIVGRTVVEGVFARRFRAEMNSRMRPGVLDTGRPVAPNELFFLAAIARMRSGVIVLFSRACLPSAVPS